MANHHVHCHAVSHSCRPRIVRRCLTIRLGSNLKVCIQKFEFKLLMFWMLFWCNSTAVEPMLGNNKLEIEGEELNEHWMDRKVSIWRAKFLLGLCTKWGSWTRSRFALDCRLLWAALIATSAGIQILRIHNSPTALRRSSKIDIGSNEMLDMLRVCEHCSTRLPSWKRFEW